MKNYFIQKDELSNSFSNIYKYLLYSKESFSTLNCLYMLKNNQAEYNQEIIDLYNKLYQKVKNYENTLYKENTI